MQPYGFFRDGEMAREVATRNGRLAAHERDNALIQRIELHRTVPRPTAAGRLGAPFHAAPRSRSS